METFGYRILQHVSVGSNVMSVDVCASEKFWSNVILISSCQLSPFFPLISFPLFSSHFISSEFIRSSLLYILIFISSHVISPHLSAHLTQFYLLILSHLPPSSPYFISFHLTSCILISSSPIYLLLSFHLILCHVYQFHHLISSHALA